VAAPLAIGSVSNARGHGLAAAAGATSPGALVVALALPLLFLHRTWQPAVGSVTLSDVAVLAVVVAALAAAVRRGLAPLVAGRLVWLTWAFFLFWLTVATAYGAARFGAYPLRKHAVTLAKWDEYALLAPALPLLLRRRRDLDVVLWSLALWSAAATVVGLLEFFGVDVAAKGTIGKRQASFLGSSDFAALSGAALLAGAVGRRGALAWISIAAGGLGTIVAGSLSAVLGLVTALAALGLFVVRSDRRRALAIAATLAVVVAASLVIRSADVSAFQRFLGGETTERANPNKVQTYAHRTVLAYIGGRIWLAHPLLGVGWQGSGDAWAYMPYVPDAKRKFPDEPPLAFPPPHRTYGVQFLYLQALADLGVLGLVAVVAVFASAFAVAVRARETTPGRIAALWILFVAWCWTAQGFIAGIPLDALTWLAVGLAANAAASRHAGA
jgi:O-antigen ligase